MKNVLFVILLSFSLLSCSKDDDFLYHEIEDSFDISCPDPPIEIMSNLDEKAILEGEKQLNMFCILQVSESLYYMYYETYDDKVIDFQGKIKFAFSTDGIHWERSFPDKSKKDNVIIQGGATGVSVIEVPDINCPYRMFGYGEYDGCLGIYMWKSKDGINFTREGVVLEGTYDTQQVAVVKGNRIKIYTRLWSDDHKNRRIGVFYVNFDGILLSSPEFLQDEFLYNSAASVYDDEKYDFLFPTYFNNMMGGADAAYIKALIVDGHNSKELPCDFNRWVDSDEPWVLVAPGIINIAGENYISYHTTSWSHDSGMPVGGVCKYYLLKVHITSIDRNL